MLQPATSPGESAPILVVIKGPGAPVGPVNPRGPV